jgi:hypothetical protein
MQSSFLQYDSSPSILVRQSPPTRKASPRERKRKATDKLPNGGEPRRRKKPSQIQTGGINICQGTGLASPASNISPNLHSTWPSPTLAQGSDAIASSGNPSPPAGGDTDIQQPMWPTGQPGTWNRGPRSLIRTDVCLM